MVIENLGQLEFLSDHLNTLINIEWKKKIASSVKEEYVLNMYKNLGKLDIDKFRPFAWKMYKKNVKMSQHYVDPFIANNSFKMNKFSC